jgi:parallel beta helix pectate lyase-like protein
VKSRTMPSKRRALRWLIVPILALAAVLWPQGGAGAAPACDRYASPLGLNLNPGTELLPFRTAQRLANSLQPGETGCLRGGTYAGGLTITHGGRAGAPVRIQSEPGERALLIGRVVVDPGADHVTLANMDLVGINAALQASPTILADDVAIVGNDITNLQTPGDCVFVGGNGNPVARTAIVRNRIHNCGMIPLTNRHHGISVWSARDTQIVRNEIFDNADRGIQLYPDSQRTHAEYNTIDGNGVGVLIGGTEATTSNGNVLEHNLITNSDSRDNIEAHWPGAVGSGNVIRENCVSGGPRDDGDGGIRPRMDGVTISNNLTADPGYVNRNAKDFELQASSVCRPLINGLVWQPFRDDSIWNVTANQKGIPTAVNPFASQFVSYSNSLEISGIPGSGSGDEFAKPTYFAKPGDPVAPVQVAEPTWVKGDIHWDGKPIPVPAGVEPAPGSDGHLTIVSADRRTAWEMWRCTKADKSGYQTVTIAQWDLTGTGVPGDSVNNSSARGSGTPLLPTTIRATEAFSGINHALGITVPRVSSDYIYPPATHSDGGLGADGIKYGMLFVLRADFPIPANATVGERNVIRGLKAYGAYVVDQGASMELDADSTHPRAWQGAGLDANSLNSIGPNDFRRIILTP